MRIGVGYPARADEWEVLARRMARAEDEIELDPVVDSDTLLQMQRALEQVHVSEQVGLYMVDLVAGTRVSPRVQVGSSPRGTLALLKLSRGRAALQGRDFVTPDDVKAVAVPALAHRLTLRPELWVQRVSEATMVPTLQSDTSGHRCRHRGARRVDPLPPVPSPRRFRLGISAWTASEA